MKFGGSSLANTGRFHSVAEIVRTQLHHRPVLVLSAIGDTTDLLLEAGEEAIKNGVVDIERIEKLHLGIIAEMKLNDAVSTEIKPLLEELKSLLTGISLIKELTARTRAYLVSFGERLSVRIAAAYFSSIGIKAQAADAWDMGFLSDSNFTYAELKDESWELIPNKFLSLGDNILQIVTGFIAKDENGNITTLGRGGSDLTATMLAAACGAREVQVWKDVDGILSADPRIVKNALPVKIITYEEAIALAYFSDQVLHPRAIQPCRKAKIPILVKNSYNPQASGTRIVMTADGKTNPIKAIAFRKNATLVDMVSYRMHGQYGFLAELFSYFARHCMSIDMVATSEVSVSILLDMNYDLSVIKEELSRIASVSISPGKAIVAIIGDIGRSSEILSHSLRICEHLGVQIQMISQGGSKVNLNFIMDVDKVEEVVEKLHRDFFEDSK